MRRIWTFVLGMAAGGFLLWGALHYHLLQTKDGMRLIPKVNTTLANTYVDIRGFTIADWAQHVDLARALANANQGELIGNTAEDALNNSLDRILNGAEQR